MKSFNVGWYERMYLLARVSTMQGANLRACGTLLRIIERLRPTDEEQITTGLREANGQCTWDALPSIDYGARTVELEEEEAATLAKGLDEHPDPVRVSDAVWLLRLLATLRGEVFSVPQRAEAKESAA